jgi:hypothetical protein
MLRVEIPVEPLDFDSLVRAPGMDWMKENNIDLEKPLPKRTEIPSYWRRCVDNLRASFGEWCCYTGRYLYESDIVPVDHLLPKKDHPNLAYEWSNFRYTAYRVNSRKWQKYILDPACLPKGIAVYVLEFFDGSISANLDLKSDLPGLYQAADDTIEELGLDEPLYRRERMLIWDTYLNGSKGNSEKNLLKKTNNFVWSEAVRQNLL